MKIEIAELSNQDKIERKACAVNFAIEITDFKNTPFLDRMFGRSNFLTQREDESDDEFKNRVAENTIDTGFYYEHINKFQQRFFNKTAKQMIRGFVGCGQDARKLKKQYRKIGLIKGKFN